MKRAILLFLVSLVSIAAHGQGSVTFQNASTIAGWNPVADRNVKFGNSMAFYNPLIVAGANVSSNYAGINLSSLRAALLYAPGVVADSNWYTITSLAKPTNGFVFAATFKKVHIFHGRFLVRWNENDGRHPSAKRRGKFDGFRLG